MLTGCVMSETVWSRFSDDVMRQALRNRDGIVFLRDKAFRGLRLRSHLGGQSGAWEVRHQSRWHKAGAWPQVGALDMLAGLSGALTALRAGVESDRGAGVLCTVGDLLDWYALKFGGAQVTTTTKRRRRSNVRVWLRWLSPLSLPSLTVWNVDRLLIQPMKDADRAPATIAQVYHTLRLALRAAVRLRLIAADPLAGVTLADFKVGPILAREGRLRPQDVGWLVGELVSCWGRRRHRRAAVLALLMLAHGTRIGETRQARWEHFDLERGWWVLPASTTKMRRGHELPLTGPVVELLRQYRASQGRGGSGFLFPVRGGGGAVSAERASMMLRVISGGRWSAHDLRKLASGCWRLLGVTDVVAERLLSHAPTLLEAAYVQVDLRGLERDALERWHGVGNAQVCGMGLEMAFSGVFSGG